MSNIATRILRILEMMPIAVGGTLLVLLTAVVGANVVARFGFNAGFIWSDELARFSLIWITFLGSAVLVRLGEHIAVDLVVESAPGRLKKGLQIFSHLVIIVIALVLIWQGASQVFMQRYQISPALEINIGLVYLVVPMAGAYQFVYAVFQILSVLGADRPEAASRET